MSIHAKTSKEAMILARKQERQSRVLSIVMAFLVILLITIILALFSLPSLVFEPPTIVTYVSEKIEEQQASKPVVQTSRKPSAPSQSMARVIAANTEAPTSVPVPDFEVAQPSLDFGDGDDFGQGWGDEGFGSGSASFFGQQVKANRIVYVIDFSISMQGEREKLMRKELAKSVSTLTHGVKYQLIFFSGPAWVAGDRVGAMGMSASVTSGGQTYHWRSATKSQFEWDVTDKSKVQTPEWRDASESNINQSLEHIKNTKLIAGTVWLPPMEMALRMDPPPQVIYFMTDGMSGSDSDKLANKIAGLAREKRVIVNTIALMEPKARGPMIDLARETGGQASMVEKDGKHQILRK